MGNHYYHLPDQAQANSALGAQLDDIRILPTDALKVVYHAPFWREAVMWTVIDPLDQEDTSGPSFSVRSRLEQIIVEGMAGMSSPKVGETLEEAKQGVREMGIEHWGSFGSFLSVHAVARRAHWSDERPLFVIGGFNDVDVDNDVPSPCGSSLELLRGHNFPWMLPVVNIQLAAIALFGNTIPKDDEEAESLGHVIDQWHFAAGEGPEA